MLVRYSDQVMSLLCLLLKLSWISCAVVVLCSYELYINVEKPIIWSSQGVWQSAFTQFAWCVGRWYWNSTGLVSSFQNSISCSLLSLLLLSYSARGFFFEPLKKSFIHIKPSLQRIGKRDKGGTATQLQGREFLRARAATSWATLLADLRT